MLEETIILRKRLYDLTNGSTKNRQELLEFVESINLIERSKYVWVWPRQDQLDRLQVVLKQFKITCILSVGCGNGLLEWLIMESTGVQLFGLEVDRNWWQSVHAVKSFIPLNFNDDVREEFGDLLQHCCHSHNWDFALLFCYFNNRKAFLHYLQMYKGNWLILIGPQLDAGIHTDPNALEPQFPANSQWQLRDQFCFGTNDVLAIYSNL